VRFIISRKQDADAINESFVQVFPNPTQGDVQLLVNSQEMIKGIEVMNSAGQVVFRSEESQTFINKKQSLSLSPFPAGVYMIRVQLESGVIVKRLIKN
jgi:hypothetical protein